FGCCGVEDKHRPVKQAGSVPPPRRRRGGRPARIAAAPRLLYGVQKGGALGPSRLTESFPRRFSDARAAVSAIAELYERNTTMLREAFVAFAKGEAFTRRIRAHYPYVKIAPDHLPDVDPRAAYGFLPDPGTYATTVTRPDIFGRYLEEQIRLLV